MKYLFSFLMVFSLQPCFGQKQLFLTTSAGWKVNYTQIVSDKPLPSGMMHVSKWSGFSAGVGLEYKVSDNWACHFQLKVADVKMGIRKQLWVEYDSVSGKYSTLKGGGESDRVGLQPLHIQLGFTYYNQALKIEKLRWFLGSGVAYVRNRPGFAPDIVFLAEVNQPGRSRNYGKSFEIGMQEDYLRKGMYLNVHTGLDFNFAPNHHLLLTLQHNQGLWNIWQYQSRYFVYIDKTPNNTTYEPFDVKLRTKGSYSALQLGYKYAITGRKKS